MMQNSSGRPPDDDILERISELIDGGDATVKFRGVVGFNKGP